MGYCPICGREIEANTKICPVCGYVRESGFDENKSGEDHNRDGSRPNRDSRRTPRDRKMSIYDDDPLIFDDHKSIYDDGPSYIDDSTPIYDSPIDYDSAGPGNGNNYGNPGSGRGSNYGGSGDSDEPSGVWGRITAAVGGFFGDGPENKNFVVVGAALLAAIVIVGGVLMYGLFFRKTGSAGPGEVASNAGVTSSSTGANNGATAKPSSSTGKDDYSDVIDTTPTDEMKKRQEEAEKRKAEKAQREAEEKKAAEQKKAEEAKKAEEQKKAEEEAKKKAEEEAKKKAEEREKSEKAKEEAAKERHAEEEAKKKAEEEAKKKAEEEAKKKAEEDTMENGQNGQDKDQTPAETPKEAETGKYATAEEAFEDIYKGKSFLYGQQYTGYITDPALTNAGLVGLDFTEVPAGDVACYVYDFDDDGANELLNLELTQDGTILASVYEYDGEVATEEALKLIEIDDKEKGRKTVCRMFGGVPAFANAFVYKVDGETRIGFEFAYTAVHANGTEHDILSYAYKGSSLELRDYYGMAGSTIDMEVKENRDFYKEMYEAFVKLGAGAMSADDIVSMWNMETHFVDYMKDVHEIYRGENTLSGGGSFDYVKWEQDGKKRTEYSAIRFTDLKGLFNGDGPKYKEPVPFPEEEEKKTEEVQQDQNAGNGQQDQNTGNGGNAGGDNTNGEKQSEQTPEPATDGNSGQNTETPSNNSGSVPADDNAGTGDNIDLSFLNGVWERIGGQVEGYSQPTIVFEDNVAHYHTDVSDFDVAIREIVKTDYGCFLRLDDGTYQYGFRWDASDPDVLSHVDTWDTEDMSTYSGSDSYAKVK